MNAENLWLNASAILAMLAGAVTGTWWLGKQINDLDQKISKVIETMSSKFATISRVEKIEAEMKHDHDNLTRLQIRMETLERQ